MRIQAFGPELAIQAFNERIVCGFSGPGKVHFHALRIGPKVKIFRDKLRSLVDPDGLRLAKRGADLFEGL